MDPDAHEFPSSSDEFPSSPSDGVADDQTAAEPPPPPLPAANGRRNRYDEQKRRDWNAFLRFLDRRTPRLTLSRVRSPHVIEFLESVDHLGKTLVHEPACPHFGRPETPEPPCGCPLRQSWGSLDALVGRLRAAFDRARPDANPFGVRAVRNYLLRLKDTQATARGIPYSKKRKVPTFDGPVISPAEGSAYSPPATTAANVEEPTAANVEEPTAPPVVVPLVGPFGQNPAVNLQVCWVRPPVLDNHSPAPLYPIWRYPNMQSLVPFLPPFPCVPPLTLQESSELRVPKHESQSEEEPPGTRNGASLTGVDPTPHQRSRYEEQKRRDWNTFLRFLDDRQPRLTLSRVRSPHVIEFLESLDQFGKTLVHESGCPYFGNSDPGAPCGCPLRQSWGSLDALVGRLRAACEENPNRPETNPFGVRAVRNFLLHLKDSQATARGIPYSRKRKRSLSNTVEEEGPSDVAVGGSSTNGGEDSAADGVSGFALGEEFTDLLDYSSAAY